VIVGFDRGMHYAVCWGPSGYHCDRWWHS